MRFERKFLAFKEGDAPTATDGDINNLIDMLNDHFGDTQADWMEEETRFPVGSLTVVVFKLSYFDDDVIEIRSDEKGDPVRYVFDNEIKATDLSVNHFSTPVEEVADDGDSWW